MKLLSLRLTTLKSKLYAIVFVSIVVRVIGFFLLPSQPSVALAPDEGGYAEISRIVADEQPTTSFGGLYVISRSLVLPAVVLNNFGSEPLSSVRITASIYGALSLMLVAFIILKTINKYQQFKELTSKRNNVIIGLFGVYALLPSHLLWSMLGLRESPMEFWVLCALASVYSALYLQERLSLFIAFSLIISVTLLFNTRPQVAWVLGVTILIFLLTRFRSRIAVLLIPITFIALGLGYASVTIQNQDVFALTSVDGSAVDGSACQKSEEKIVVQEVEYICKKIGTKTDLSGLQNPGLLLVEETEAIPDRHKGNQVLAASAIQTLFCPITEESKLDKYLCMAWRAPYMSTTFLFRPLIGVDVTSTSSLFAALENIAWLGAFIFIVVMLIKKRRLAFFGPLTPPLIFFALYCVGAGSYEGNLGTAFRHKSLILWVVLLLTGSVIAAEKKTNSGNERHQKAV
jgi:hypothetical protein